MKTEKGVFEGNQMVASGDNGAPTFLVYARRDVIGANQDRIQIVKG
jgi:hypothetical protein